PVRHDDDERGRRGRGCAVRCGDGRVPGHEPARRPRERDGRAAAPGWHELSTDRRELGGGPMTAHAYAGNTAIVGIGATEFSKDSGRSELQLALEACAAACEDAGVDPREVNGLSTFTMETNPENDIMRGLGIRELTHFSRIHFG